MNGTEGVTLSLSAISFNTGYAANGNGALGQIEVSQLPGSGTLMLNGNPVTIGQVITAAQLNAGGLTYQPVADANGIITFKYKAVSTDGVAASDTKNVSLNIAAVNDDPVVTVGTGATPNFISGGGAKVVDDAITLVDVDSADLAGGQLTVQVTTNGSANDVISIENQGTSAGQIGFSGGNVTYGNVVIGTASGGTGTNALVITLSGANATPAAVQALMRAVTYNHTGTPNEGTDPILSFTLTDGDGGQSGTVTRTLNIVTNSPIVSTLGGQTGFLPGDGGVSVDPSLSLADPQQDFSGGTLVAAITTNGEATDLLSVANQGTAAGQVGVNGSNITYGGVIVGTFSGGSGTTPLTITFNAAATDTSVQAVGRAVQYDSTSADPGVGNRSVSFNLTDAASNSGPVVSRTITIDQTVETFSTTATSEQVLRFDGTDDLMTINLDNTTRGTLVNGSAATWEAWINSSTTSGTMGIFGAGDAGSNGALVVANGVLGYQLNGASITSSGQAVADGNWHHVAMSHDGEGALKFYVDGLLISTHSGVSKELSGGDAHIARSPESLTSFFNGDIAEVRVWDKVLSDTEIQNTFEPNISSPSSVSNLVGYWNMSSGLAAQTLSDTSANSNDAVLGLNTLAGSRDPSAETGSLHPYTSTDWIVVEGGGANGNDSVSLESGDAIIANRELLRSSAELDPTAKTPIHLSGTFRFKDTNDYFHVVTRADPSSFTSSGFPSNGINFQADLNNNILSLESVSSSTTTVLASSGDSSITLTANKEYRFDVFDTGSTVRFLVSEVGNPSNSADITGTSSLDPSTNYVVVTNREYTTETHRVAVDDLTLNHGFVTDEGTALSGLLDAPTVSGTLTYSVVAGGDASHGTFTITDAANGSFTYTPTSGFHGVETVRYQVVDATGATDTKTLSISVAPVVTIGSAASFARFDGNDSNTAMQSANTLTLTSHTMELWVNTQTTDPDQGYLALDDSGGKVAQILTEADGAWRVEISNDGTNFKRYESSIVINDGNWHHLAYSYDAATDTLILYVDGVEDTAMTKPHDVSLTNFSITDEVYVGQNRGENGVVAGQVDEVRIWNDVRTSTEIRDNYTRQIDNPTSDSSLAAYYRFDDTSDPAKAQNLSSAGDTLDLTIGNGASIINPTARAMRLDGTGDQINLGSPQAFNFGSADFSYEIWFQTDVTDNNRMDLVDLGSNNASNQGGFLFIEDGNLRFDTAGSPDIASAASVNDGIWHHAAVTRTGTTVRLYLDGVLAGISELTFTIPNAGTTTIGNGFTGEIADARFWNTVRTDDEIAENYNQELDGGQSGLVAHYKFNETSGTTLVDSVGDNNGTLAGNPTWVDVGPAVDGLQLTIAEDADASGTLTPKDGAGTVTYSVSGTASNGTVTVDQNGNWTYTPKENFHGTDTFSLQTVSSVHGTYTKPVTVTIKSVTEKSVIVSGGALQFDGVDDFVDIANNGNSLDIGNSGSFEAWVTKDTWNTTSATQTIIGNGRAYTDANAVYMALHNSLGFHFRYGGDSGDSLSFSGTDAFAAGSSHHLAATWSTTEIALYVDGELVASKTGTFNVSDANPSWNLGKQSQVTHVDWFKGQMDEVRIWDTTRTASEIHDNYDQRISGTLPPALKAYFQFDGQSTAGVVQDATANGNVGTIDGAKIVNLPGTSIRFDGSNDYIEVGRGTGDELAITGDLTIETWAKFDDTGNNPLVYFAAPGSISATNVLYGLRMISGGDIRFFHENGSGANNTIDFNTNLVAGQWYHISTVRDTEANIVKLYIDGQLFGADTYVNEADGGGSARLLIGFKDNDTDYYLNGEMADVRIWNTARTDAEIADNYNEVLTGDQGGSLLLNYTFEDGQGTTVTDTARANNGVIKSDAVYADTGPDIFGTTLTVLENQSVSGSMTANDIVQSVMDVGRPGADNVGSGMKVENFTDFPSSAITMEMWINPDQIAASQALFSYAVPGSINEFTVFMQSETSVELYINDSSATHSGFKFTVGEWSHLSFTWDSTASGDNLLMYQDGVLVKEVNTSTATALATGGTMYLGTDQDSSVGAGFDNSQTFDGQMAEVRLWNDVRTGTEIATNYDKELTGTESGLVANWQLNEGSGSVAIDKAGNNNGTYETASTGFTSDAQVLPLTNDGTQFSVTGAGTADADGWVTATTSKGGTVKVNTITGDYVYTPATDYFGTDSFQLTAVGDGASSVTDSETISVTVNSVIENSVNVAGGAAQFSRSPHGQAVASSGTHDRVTADLGTSTFTNQITVEALVQFNDLTLGQQHNFFNLYGETNNHVLNMFKDGNNKLSFTTGSSATVDSGITVAADTWYHVAMVYDAGTIYTYVDGNLVGQSSSTLDLNNGGQQAKLVLGGNPLSNSAFTGDTVDFGGMLDEVRVWNDARTAEEIRTNLDQQLSGSESNLQAYYRFDEDDGDVITDHSGNNRHASSAVGKALTLDGTDDFVSIANDAALNVTNWTIETWFQTSSHTSSGDANIGRLISKAQGTGGNQYSLYMLEGKVYLATNTISPHTVASTEAFNDGDWHHVAGVFDGTNLRLYVDGELVAEALNVTGSPTLDTKALTIGAYDDGTPAEQFFNGNIDEVRIWSDARTEAEIRENMHTGVDADSTNLIANYTFDDDTTAVDNSQGTAALDGTLQGGATLTASADSPVRSGVEIVRLPSKALNFDGTDDFITVPNLGVNFSDITIETWINLDNLPTGGGYHMIIGNAVHAVAGDLHLEFQDFSGVKKLVWGESGNSSVFSHDFASDIGSWMHISVVRDTSANNLHLYLNGDLTETISYTSESTITLDDAQIGAEAGAGRFLDGQLSNFRIWDTARTGAEVQGTYSQTLTGTQNGNLIVNYTMDEVVSSTLTDHAGTSQDATVNGGATIVDVAPVVLGTTLTVEEGKTATGMMNASDVQGTATYSVVSNPATGQGSVEIDSSSGQWTYTPPENWAGTTSFQIRASGSNSSTDTETISVTVQAEAENAVHGGAIQLDGVNDYVDLGTIKDASGNNISGAYSIEAWVNTSTYSTGGNGYARIVEMSQGVAANNIFLSLEGTNGKVLLSNFVGASSTHSVTQAQLPLNEWVHVAAVNDGDGTGQASIYFNGVLQALDASSTASISAGADVERSENFIGRSSWDTDDYFTGMIDDVRIWNDARTAQEIADNYNEQIDPNSDQLVAHYQFDDVKGNVVRDATDNNNDATLIGEKSGPTGNILNVTDVDSVDDGMNATLASGSVSSAVTMESWVNFDRAGTQENFMSLLSASGGLFSRFVMVRLSTGELQFFIGDSTDDHTIQSATGLTTDNTWHHIAMTYDSADAGGAAYIYLDGVQVASGTIAGGDLAGGVAQSLTVGNDQNTFFFDGQLDNVRVWNTARSAEEIREGMTQIYDYDTSNLVSQYTFDDVSNTTVNDNTNVQANGTLTNGATIVESGNSSPQFINHLGNALRFDGNDAVNFSGNFLPDAGNARTFMLWAKTSVGTGQILMKYGNAAQGEWITFGHASQGLFLDIHTSYIEVQPETAIGDGQWHHYALVIGAGSTTADAKIYQDGVLLTGITSASNQTQAINTAAAANFSIGESFNGDMTEFSAWSTALTTAQVNDYMSKSLSGDETGLVSYYKMDEEPGSTSISDSAGNNNSSSFTGDPTFVANAPTIEGSSLVIAENTSASGQMTDTDVTGTPTYTLIGSPHLGQVDLDANTGQWTYTPNANTQGSDSFTIRASGATSGIDEETVSIDIGKDPTRSTDYAMRFDGVNDYVEVFDADGINMGDTNWTMEAWFQTTATNTGVLFGKSNVGIQAWQNGGKALLIENGQLVFDAFGQVQSKGTLTNLNDGAWHHVALSYDAANNQTRMFVDGTAEAFSTVTGGSGTINSGVLTATMLADVSGDTFKVGYVTSNFGDEFTGNINEVRYWDTTRTATQVSENMDRQMNGDETGLVGYWDFDEGAGAIATDQSGNGNDGVLTNGPTYKNLTTVTMGNGESYKGMILGEDVDGDNLSYAINANSSLEGFTLTGNTFSYDSHATNDGTNEVSIDITDENGDVTTEALQFVVS